MSWIKNEDYVVAYNAKLVINTGVFIGTKKYLIIVPSIKKEGAGFRHTTTTYSMGGKSMEETVEQLLADKSTNEDTLINTIKSWQATDTKIINLSELDDLKINASWLSKNIVIRHKGQRGWVPLCHSLGDTAKEIKSFYNK
ncbi:MAG: hypothetical protein ACE5FF_16210 [Saprospiraceae bacterium]